MKIKIIVITDKSNMDSWMMWELGSRDSIIKVNYNIILWNI